MHISTPARRTPRLLVSGLVTTALATGGLVTATVAPAAADPVEAVYLCEFPLLDELEVPVTLDVPELPDELTVGLPVPGGQWDVEGLAVLPDFVLTLLLGVLGISARTQDLSLFLGGEPVPVDLTSPLDSLPLGDIDMPLAGTNRQFVPSRTGQQQLVVPDTFNLVVLDDLGLSLLDVPCEFFGDDDVIDTVDVVKQRSTVSAQVTKKPVREGRRPKVLVNVLNQVEQGATGSVVATLAGKVVGRGSLKQGTSRLKLAKLPVGRHRVLLTYSGSETVSKATKTVTVRVRKKS